MGRLCGATLLQFGSESSPSGFIQSEPAVVKGHSGVVHSQILNREGGNRSIRRIWPAHADYGHRRWTGEVGDYEIRHNTVRPRALPIRLGVVAPLHPPRATEQGGLLGRKSNLGAQGEKRK